MAQESYIAEIHGVTEYNRKPAIYMKVPDLGGYVNAFVISGGRTSPAMAQVLQQVGGRCPKQDRWDADCDSSHGIVEVTAEMVRGALKAPARSGQNANVPRDPSKDYNYNWEVVSIEGIAAIGGSPTATTKKPTTGDLTALIREQGVNDRKGLELAIQFNAPTAEEIIETGELFAKWLNDRAVARVNPLVNEAITAGANVVSVADKPQITKSAVVEELPSIAFPKNVADRAAMDGWVKANNIKLEDVRQTLSAQGYTNSQDYIDKNPEQGFAGLAQYLHQHLVTGPFYQAVTGEEPLQEELPW